MGDNGKLILLTSHISNNQYEVTISSHFWPRYQTIFCCSSKTLMDAIVMR
jgi:hypothetical protein